jgi:hypothetical protein
MATIGTSASSDAREYVTAIPAAQAATPTASGQRRPPSRSATSPAATATSRKHVRW